MAEMVGSTLVQEAVSRVVSFVLGKREEKASQGHMIERLEMAASGLEHALERSAKLPITDVALLQRRIKIKCVYAEAMQLLDRHKEQEVKEGFGFVQGLKRKRSWITVRGNNLPITSSASLLSTDEVGRFERLADWAHKFVSDVESGWSLWHNNFFNPIIGHLLQGKALGYQMKQGDQLRDVRIHSWRSEERGTEATLRYRYGDWTRKREKYFNLRLVLRLSESIDIVGVAIKGLQLLASQFKLADESAVGELTLLPNLLQGPWKQVDDTFCKSWEDALWAQRCRPDPACCGASRHSNVSSELSHIFSEEIIFFGLDCCISAAVEPSSRSRSSSLEAGRRRPEAPLAVSVGFQPHESWWVPDSSLVIVSTGDVEARRDVSIQQVSETLKSDAINCFLNQPGLTGYRMDWYTTHGTAWFVVTKPTIERTRRRRRHNTRGSAKPNAIRR